MPRMGASPTVRRMVPVLAAALAVAAGPLVLAAGPAGADTGRSLVAAIVPAPVLADRDGDRVSDDLEAALLAAHPSTAFEVIVRTADGDPSEAQAGAGPFQVRRALPLIGGFAATMTAGQALALAADAGTVRVDRDGTVVLSNNGNGADFGANHAKVDFDVTGAGVGICVIDSGADPVHEQLDSKVSASRWLDLINQLPTPYDDHNNGVGGHGTHVSSIAAGDGIGGPQAATYQGVAPNAELYVVKAFPGAVPDDLPSVSPGSTQESITVAAIDWCARQPGVDIVSMSFTKVGPTDGTDPLGAAVDAAVHQHGKVAVAAAGNDGPQPGLLGSPGAAASAITVGATADWSLPATAPNRSDGPFLPAFSSRGPTLDGRIKPDVVAPGHSVFAAWSGTAATYLDKSGTSMATPFAAGAMALALERNPALTPADLAALVQATAIDRGPAGKDSDWGAGMIDVFGLVSRADGSAVYAPTPFPTHAVLTGSTSPGSPWTHSITLGGADLNVPIAATVLVDGGPDVSGAFWDPNLQVTLTDPLGVSLDVSDCPLLPDANDCLGNTAKAGRQELVRARPTVAGTYTLTVEPSSVAGLGSLNGGSFLVDLSHGPVAAAAVPPPCTTAWTGGAGSWHTPGSWSAGLVPLPTDVVCIPANGIVSHAVGITSVRGALIDGRLTVTGASTLQLTDPALSSVVSGQLVIDTGALVTATAEVDLRGVLRGTGALEGALANRGDVLPGGAGVGTLSVRGDYRQEPAGVLSVNVNGTPGVLHDLLSLTGAVSFDGALSITTGYAPLAGDDVEIVDVTGARLGRWSQVAGSALAGGLSWAVDDATDVHLRAGPPPPPPPPGAIIICHQPGTPAEKTMTLPAPAAESHRRAHGDRAGPCP